MDIPFYKPAVPHRKLALCTSTGPKEKTQESHCCISMKLSLEDDKVPLYYSPIYREYDISLLYKNRVTALQGMVYCPWCSTTLPISLRDEWFELLEKEYNIDRPFDDDEEKLIP